MTELNLALLLIGGLTLVLGLIAGLMRSRVLFLSEPLAAVVLGVAVGPHGFDLLDLARWGDSKSILEQVARLTVAVAVMSSALRLPNAYFRRHIGTMTVLLSLGMLAMWLVSGLLAYALLGLPFWVAMLLGAVVTPTDPVLAATIATGKEAEKNIPARLRNVLTAEAGANDGGAYPLVFLAILMLAHPPEHALSEWLTRTLLWEVLAAVVIGFLIGYLAGLVERWSSTRHYLEETSLLTITVALSAAVLGGAKLVGTDGILAVFAAGIGFNLTAERQDEHQDQKVQESVNRLFTLPVFVLFGMMLPWGAWGGLGWLGLTLAVGVLLLRRLPMMVALSPFLQPLKSKADVVFTGWFGPIGVAALFYALVAERETGRAEVWVAASLVIFASVVAYGVTATPFTKLYGNWAKRQEAPDDEA